MRTKNKSFIEDTFILFIFGIIIYVIYSFLFSSDENLSIEENKTIVETRIDTMINKEPTINETKKDEVLLDEVDKNINKVQKEDINTKENLTNKDDRILVEKKIEVKEIEKPVIDKEEGKDSIELLYKDITEKINMNIKRNFKENQFKNSEYVNIRLTILKNGKYEQLTFMDGNNEYFNLINPSILETFPVKINDSIKENFPRYFRMKIEF